ncbi:hypothetical protein [Mycobacterium talmoniae]|uniref:Uncharacterized protein n=2 Tax=Mycobacterium talmoniae TaxID=1858794 RepID=A0A2S8BIZ9_9MYCO|nr:MULTISPECIES: hypothetical protein [Mycobacterium]PQM46599.1 hypothetical protein C1Y40_03229 [Mycobacterium talmoniae]TDH49491.1 hypothetical protein E2F47_20630 [Mycobacterium eburneum]
MTDLAGAYISARGAGLGFLFARMDWRISLSIAVICLIIWGIVKAVGSQKQDQQGQPQQQPPQQPYGGQPPYPPQQGQPPYPPQQSYGGQQGQPPYPPAANG